MADSLKRSVDGWVRGLDERLRDKNFWFVAQMDQLEQKTGLKRANVALGELQGCG